jgi:8-oxo-dGTP pyrophosphatase MutT (NUDIX family)
MICSGALFYAQNTERFLFLHRTQGRRSNVWGLPGGTNEAGETSWQACEREISEEIGYTSISKIIPLERFCSKNNSFEYHTYLCLVGKEFIPILNHEHDGYAWTSYKKWPRPLHYGVAKTLNKKSNQTKLQTVLEIISPIQTELQSYTQN